MRFFLAPPWFGAYGLSVERNPEKAADHYTPLRTGLRGSHPGSFEVGPKLRDRRAWVAPNQNNPVPTSGLRSSCAEPRRRGLTPRDTDWMTKENPATLLGLR